MNQVFFSHNAAIIRASFSTEINVSTSLESLSKAGVGYLERGLSLVLLLFLSPVLLVVAGLNRLLTKGPVFYSQPRIGQGGKVFNVFKFRTMIVDAEDKTGPILSWGADPRITPLGKFLRKTHLDELPQLLNVARGEMSIIGPRPERPEFVSTYSEQIPHYEIRHRSKPGITGLAQICCDYDAKAEEKLEYDLLYLKNRSSLRLNCFILFRTFLKMLLVH